MLINQQTTLGYLYQSASIKLENIYELGAFAVIVFLFILCILPIGSKKDFIE